MAEQRLNQLLLILPLFLIACDLWTAISLPTRNQKQQQKVPPRFVAGKDSTSLDGNFHISYCTSCSFKNAAMQTKNMLENEFPGRVVTLSNYPPPMHKMLLSKVVSGVQMGTMALLFAGDHIFPRLGYAVPPQWFNTLRANRMGSVAGSMLVGNMAQNFLKNTGAFEVHFDGDLIFSKLQTNRFPTNVELQDRIFKNLERKSAYPS